ncbi:MAG: phosphotransferase family protein [Caldilineaceae bacterium]|nr:phosphotransferase family protein [Caldilineaceae bacterium]
MHAEILMGMTNPSQTQAFAALVQTIAPHGHLLRVWPLAGGVSATVMAFEFVHANGEHQTLVIRQHGTADLARNPQIAADEYCLLQLLQDHGIAAPKPYAHGQAGPIAPTPYLVIDYIEGEPRFTPTDPPDFLAQSAAQLARLHRIQGDQVALAFLPNQTATYTRLLNTPPVQLDESLAEGTIRARLAGHWPPAQQNPTVLLHGDFWPGNLLWHAEQLVAVIDWEDAAVGDPLADVANSRLELLWACGRDAMEQFTAAYQARTTCDFSPLPLWDLCAALRPAGKLASWGLGAATEQAMRASHAWFVTQALAQLT